jgi:hypothetical protein
MIFGRDSLARAGKTVYNGTATQRIFAMKVNFDIECTPEEARRFLGLPDLAPMQERMMKELEERLAENMRALDPETLVKTWMPMTMQGFTDMQKVFWAQMGVDVNAKDDKTSTKKPKSGE